MSSKQYWDSHYRDKDTPWETSSYHEAMQNSFLTYVPKHQPILEIGCGLGTNTRWLAQSGYEVTAIDISSEAINQVIENNQQQGNLAIKLITIDFLTDWPQLPIFPAIFDCAALQVLKEQNARENFVAAIANRCAANGYWINISCSTEQAADIAKQTGVNAPPHLSATEIIGLVEPYFEIIEMKRCRFNIDRKNQGRASFYAWGSVFQKRNSI